MSAAKVREIRRDVGSDECRMNTDFYRKMQRYLVNSGIDITVLRLRPPGTVEAAQKFLYNVDLSNFATPATFSKTLDDTTEALSKSFPSPSWGHARKCLNIFLRKAAYDHYLREKYQLGAVESLLEIPLDRHVADGITQDARNFQLPPPPKWDAIIRVTSIMNGAWQSTASEIASKREVARVHLDLWYWRAENQ